ncbi:MAG: M14 family zinc carboxypeptidase, partial [Candidatus Aminicenantes bacterium]
MFFPKHFPSKIRLQAAAVLLFIAAALALPAPAPAEQASSIDEEYTRLIKEASTRPEFLSPLIDYLPRAEGVPTPMDVLGHIAGAPDKLTYYADIIRYMRALADASPHVRVESIGETWEGREMVAVIVTGAANMDALAANKERMARLADPRLVKTEKEADALIERIIPAYLLTCNMHSTESGAAEAAMELAYRLAVDDNPIVRKIRENMIVLIVPSVEPDGHDKHTDWYYKYNQGITDYGKISRVPYWG